MSLVIFAILAYLIYYHWFPEPYFSIDGGWQGIRLIAFVDFVLGPLITFLIFDITKRRREIVLDLSVILLIQFGALTYGVVTTYNQRPLAIVLFDEFLISAVDEHFAGSLDSYDVLAEYSDEKPPIIFADLPLNREAVDEATRVKEEEGVQLHAQIDFYQPQDALKPALQERQPLFLQRLEQTDVIEELTAWLKQKENLPKQMLFGSYKGRYGEAVLIFDREARYLAYFHPGMLEID